MIPLDYKYILKHKNIKFSQVKQQIYLDLLLLF